MKLSEFKINLKNYDRLELWFSVSMKVVGVLCVSAENHYVDCWTRKVDFSLLDFFIYIWDASEGGFRRFSDSCSLILGFRYESNLFFLNSPRVTYPSSESPLNLNSLLATVLSSPNTMDDFFLNSHLYKYQVSSGWEEEVSTKWRIIKSISLFLFFFKSN